MATKVAVIGASSLIGSHIYDSLHFSFETIGTCFSSKEKSLSVLDITNKNQLEDFLVKNAPDVVVNSTGVVGKRACNPNHKLAYDVNVAGAINLAELCADKGKTLVHLSSVAVFDIFDKSKTSPYTEKDNPSLNSKDWYNMTKAVSEAFVEAICPDTTIVRIADTFGHKAGNPEDIGGSVFEWGYNTLAKGEEVSAFKNTPSNQTYLPDIGKAVALLIKKKYKGRINIGGPQINVDDFFRKVKNKFNLPGEVVVGDLVANRSLDLSKMNRLRIQTISAEEGLEKLAKHYRKQ